MPLRRPASTLTAPLTSWACTRSRKGDVALAASKRGNEHRPQEFTILAKEFLYPIEVREDLLHANGARIGFRIEPLHILMKESLEDGVLAAVPGVHHGAAVSGAAPDLRSRGRFPALLHDQLSRGVQ